MTINVLLIHSSTKTQANPPLGILYIAALLEKKGLKVEVLDCSLYGTTDIVKEILPKYKPHIVGISILTPHYPQALEVVNIVKSYAKNIWVVLGGAHPCVLPIPCLKETEADIVVLGEGEYTMYEICQAFPHMADLSRIDGVVFRRNETISSTNPKLPIKDLDSLPFPARHLANMESYFRAKATDRIRWALPQPALALIASRGCPWRCTFCASKLIHGRKIRYRSPENIQDEIYRLIQDYKIKGVYFYDDTFTSNRDWLFSLCKILTVLKVKWICGARVDQVDEEKLRRMKESGCQLISYGVESGNQQVIDGILKKDIQLEQVKYIFAVTRKIGIPIIANFMLGVPGDTEETMQETIDLSKELNPDVVEFSIYNPLPGTELAVIAQQMSTTFKTDFAYYDYSKPIFETSSLRSETIQSYHNKAVKEFYLRPQQILRQLSHLSFTNIKQHWASFKSFRSLLKRMGE